MKKIVSIALAGAAVFALSGCAGGDSGPNGAVETTSYLQEFDGVHHIAEDGVSYTCDGGSRGSTGWNGEFTYYDDEDCTFFGLDSGYPESTHGGEWQLRIRSKDNTSGTGISNVRFECDSSDGPAFDISGRTSPQGSFYFNDLGSSDCTLFFSE